MCKYKFAGAQGEALHRLHKCKSISFFVEEDKKIQPFCELPYLEEAALQDSPPNLFKCFLWKSPVVCFLNLGFSSHSHYKAKHRGNSIWVCFCGAFISNRDSLRSVPFKNVCANPPDFWRASYIGLWAISLLSLRMDIRRAIESSLLKPSML